MMDNERALIVKWLRSETQQCSSKCDCFAHGENECTCGAWWDAKESLADSIDDSVFLEGPVWGGLDLSVTTDLTAFVLIARRDGVWHVKSTFWTPEATLEAGEHLK